MIELRDYQNSAVVQTRAAIISGYRKIVIVSPTGSGKSPITADIISRASKLGKVILWLVHRRNLVIQMAETLEEFGVYPGIIMAGMEPDTRKPVQIGTFQTYQRRIKLEDGNFLIDADIIIIDEAHRSLSQGYKGILRHYKDRLLIGTTATPVRGDGRGLGEVYDSLIDVVSVKELTERGYLAPVRYYVPTDVDLAKIKVVRGDYEVKELDEKFNTPKLVGNIVQNWLKLAQNRQTIVFCINVKHSIAICEEFRSNGVAAEHLDARSSDEEREYAFARMESGDITVLCNVALYQEGMDCPDISCVVMARSTKSIGLYKQCGGRGMRPNGTHLKFIDHSGVFEEHGPLDEDIIWSLDGKEKGWKKPLKKESEIKLLKCRICHLVFSGDSKCPDCGSPVKSFGKKIEVVDGDLTEVTEKKVTMAEKRQFYGMLLHYVADRNWSVGAAAHRYRDKFKVWPSKMSSVAPILPDTAFKNYMKHLNIKHARRRRNT